MANRRSDPRTTLVLLVFFLGSRALVHLAGLGFNASTLGWYYQYLDPALLRADLGRSLFYLHSQPPLFNLMLGLFLRAFRGHESLAFEALFLSMGLVLLLTSYELLRLLDVRIALAAPLSLLLSVSPGELLNESFLFYDLPTALLLALAALFLARATQSAGKLRDRCFIGLTFSLAALGYLRSFFHWIWFLALFSLLFWVARRDRARVALSLLAALLLVGALYAKNELVFGKFAGSSWMGMSLAKVIWSGVDPAEAKELLDRGVISPTTFVPPFSPLASYGARPVDPRYQGVPALAAPLKSNGERNLNHIAYVQIGAEYQRDAFAAVRDRPGRWAHGFAAALGFFFGPSWQGLPQVEQLGLYQRLWLVLLGPHSDDPVRPVYPSLILGVLLAVTAGAIALIRKPRALAAPAIAFSLFTLLYTALAGNLLELGENERFRYMVGPLQLALLGLGLEELVRAVKKPRAAQLK